MIIDKIRKYGSHPYRVAVIHGGPGAQGEVAPMARELAKLTGILEPFQTVDSINGQVKELYEILDNNITMPITLIGWSWGAWLSVIFTVIYPSLVDKLILVGAGPFEDTYVPEINKNRLAKLDDFEKQEFTYIIKQIDIAKRHDDYLFIRFGQLITKTDSYDLIPHDNEIIEYSHSIYQKVWREASTLRKSGVLLEMARKLNCPVIAIHGKYDPHPSSGVKEPLSKVIKNFRFIELDKCGHMPWLETYARDLFFNILNEEIS